MKRSADTWIFVFLFVLLFVGGYFVAAPRTGDENKDPTTWNPDPNGVRAFYTLLGERLGYRVDRLHKPFTELPRGAGVVIVVQPQARSAGVVPIFAGDYSISRDESGALLGWVRRGGTALFLSDKLGGIPAEFRSSRRIGKGAVYAFDSRRAITNRGMRDYRNALVILRIIDRRSAGPECGRRARPEHGRRDLILFDEYHHGFAESRPLTSYVGRQVWIAMGIGLIAAIILCHTRGKRFGAVRNLPASESIRPSFEFVESVARLYRRAGATDLAADILRGNLGGGLRAKLGGDSRTKLGGDFRMKLGGDFGIATRTPQAGQKPTEQELVGIANEVHRLDAGPEKPSQARHSERSEESRRDSSLRSE